MGHGGVRRCKGGGSRVVGCKRERCNGVGLVLVVLVVVVAAAVAVEEEEEEEMEEEEEEEEVERRGELTFSCAGKVRQSLTDRLT
ncbi:hypothetical protein M0804_005947 [Polistes exclamans]|nr:hypothetical protein M0804_005947 [Polistes exclamans]